MEIKKGLEYNYSQIENFAEENGYAITEHGRDLIGENFIALSHNEKDLTISFVLTGATGTEYIYQCIYTDIK